MADGTSIYKICSQCGQSVSEAAKFCPSCGTRFPEENTGFVAYERYPEPPQDESSSVGDQTVRFSPVDQSQPAQTGAWGTPGVPAEQGGAAPLYPGPDQSAGTPGGPRPVDPAGTAGSVMDAFRKTAEAGGMTMADAARRSDAGGDINTPPPMGGKPDPDDVGRKKGLVVSIIAAVLLVAVIAVGVVMAFQLGIVGGEEPKDSMTVAQEAFEQKDFQQAIAQLEQMINDNTATAESYTLLAQAYEGSGDMEAAAKAYMDGAKALEDATLKKYAQDSYLRLAEEAKNAGDDETARKYYNLVLEELDPSNSTAISALTSIAMVSPAPSPSPSASPSPSPSASPSPTASAMPATSANPSPTPSGIAPPSPSVTGGNGTGNGTGVDGVDRVIATPTPAPTPTPTPKPTATPKPSTKPTATAKPTATPTPTPKATPQPYVTLSDGSQLVQYADQRGWTEINTYIKNSGGHLLTINSDEEFNKAVEMANKQKAVFIWLGATRNDDGTWSWVTGESLSTDDPRWLDGEPSGGADEARLAMIWIKNKGWYYVDVPDTVTEYSGKRAYIVEYDN